jgi:hypothetical protein
MRAADNQLAQEADADVMLGRISFPDPGKF